MANHRTLYRVSSLFLGNYRNFLNRYIVPVYVQDIRNKSISDKLGLPPKPKRPLTPYFKFMQQIRPTLKEKNPNASVIDITKLVALHWERIDPTVKVKLEEEFKKEQSEYFQAKLKWDSELTNEDKVAILQYKKDQEATKEKLERRKKCREFHKPTKAPTAFVLYMKKMSTTRNDAPFREWQLKQSATWNNMADADKKPYIEESKKLFNKYKEELALWEEKMIRIGNIDLVRNDSLLEPKVTKKPKQDKKNE